MADRSEDIRVLWAELRSLRLPRSEERQAKRQLRKAMREQAEHDRTQGSERKAGVDIEPD